MGDHVHARLRLLSMPEEVHHMIVSELAMQSEWSRVRGLKSLSLVWKPMQRV